MATTQSDIDPVLDKLVRGLQEKQQAIAEAMLQGKAAPWLMPPLRGWSGDLFAWDHISSAFDSAAANEMFVKAIRDVTNPGTVADIIINTTQAEWMSIAERAFRNCYTMRRPRMMAHALGRIEGHGSQQGTLVQTALEYLRNLIRSGKS